jgi:hypothetical protein
VKKKKKKNKNKNKKKKKKKKKKSCKMGARHTRRSATSMQCNQARAWLALFFCCHKTKDLLTHSSTYCNNTAINYIEHKLESKPSLAAYRVGVHGVREVAITIRPSVDVTASPPPPPLPPPPPPPPPTMVLEYSAEYSRSLLDVDAGSVQVGTN